MQDSTQPIVAIGQALKASEYKFVAPTPLTYSRVLSRPATTSGDPLVEVFGWNRPFNLDQINPSYRDMLVAGGLLTETQQGLHKSLVRFSTIGKLIFAHSGYPTDETDSVFFGPDTYRFVHALRALADRDQQFSPRTVIDIGAGTGAGGIFATSLFRLRPKTILGDVSSKALEFAEANAAINSVAVETCLSDVLANIECQGDLIISNPPYLIDAATRAYRHGGGQWGCALAIRILNEALQRLSPEGQLLLYTGSPIVRGVDKFLEEARTPLIRHTRSYRYEELDPDVFGEELEKAPYDQADRIASVSLNVKGADIIR